MLERTKAVLQSARYTKKKPAKILNVDLSMAPPRSAFSALSSAELEKVVQMLTAISIPDPIIREILDNEAPVRKLPGIVGQEWEGRRCEGCSGGRRVKRTRLDLGTFEIGPNGLRRLITIKCGPHETLFILPIGSYFGVESQSMSSSSSLRNLLASMFRPTSRFL